MVTKNINKLNFEFDRDFTMNTNTNKGMKQ